MSDVLIKLSSVHGRGVFAARRFLKNEVVLAWDNARELSRAEYEALPAAERHYVDFHEGKIFLMGAPERYVNHSCDPNTVSAKHADIALREIAPGEEITADYAVCNPPDFRMECRCGSPKCRGVVVGRAS